MSPKFPIDRAEKRQMLLQAVASVCDILTADAEESEVLRTLPPASVAAFTESGLFAMKCPAELGGAEADPVTQIEVIEATSYIDPSAGWCLMICNGGISMAGSLLPRPAIEQLFNRHRTARFCRQLLVAFSADPDASRNGAAPRSLELRRVNRPGLPRHR
jgi:indole-3-acetate monooxygenase